MRHRNLLLFIAIIVGGTIAVLRFASNDPSARGQDPGVQGRSIRGDGVPVGTSGTPASSAAPAAVTPWPGDAAWLQDAAGMGASEEALAELAQRRSTSYDIKKFASEVRYDLQTASQQLEQLAARRQWTLRASLDAAQTQALESLDRAQGLEFDQAYAGAMIASHQKALASFRTASASASDPDMRAWAEAQIPELQKHLDHARSLQQQSQEN
ncbi:MAG: DUF4142 domain-containing protein [Acidobacteriota bacterium]|nr:DUF4142 domain-containing protein [Acidobacteriota bacterium]